LIHIINQGQPVAHADNMIRLSCYRRLMKASLIGINEVYIPV